MTHIAHASPRQRSFDASPSGEIRDTPLHPPEVARIDGATHYEVGVAYEALGLPDDAIYEFQLAADDPAWTLPSWRSVGRLHHERLHWADAQSAYERAVAAMDDVGADAGGIHERLAMVKSHTPLPGSVATKASCPDRAPGLPDEDDVDQAFDDLFA